MFLGLPDPDPLVRGTNADPSIIKENNKKTSIPTVSLLVYILKNYVNVPSKSNKQKTKN
jgi:hypothetical protein